MITAEHISKQYGRTKAVNDISFGIAEGENLVLLGTSGCGKTTTLKMINRLEEPSAGRISVNGKDIAHQPPEQLRRSIGYVLQHNSLFPHYTVAENIAVVPRLLGWDKNRINRRTEELLEKMRLPLSCLNAYPAGLSGGQQQRVNIARAIAADPPILLMDEPFGALDSITRAAVTHEFSQMDEFIRKTIVLVTHDIQEAFLLGNRICLMHEGKIVQAGKPAELLFRPASDFVRDFLSASYLRLALGTVTLSDIWNYLEPVGTAASSPDTAASTPVWSAMEQMTKTGVKSLVVSDGQGQQRAAYEDTLFKAFSNYKYT